MALGGVMWGVVIPLAALTAWSVGGPAAWVGFSLLLGVFAWLALALQRRR
jgi:hypothetical protein